MTSVKDKDELRLKKQYLQKITNKYRQRNNEDPYAKFCSLQAKQKSHISDLASINSFTGNSLMQENEPSDYANTKTIYDSLFNSEEKIKQCSEIHGLLDQKIAYLKKKIADQRLNLSIKDQDIHIIKEEEPIPLLKKPLIEHMNNINQINIKANPFIVFIQMLETRDLYNFLSITKAIKKQVINALSFEAQTFIANKFEEHTQELFKDYSFKLGLDNSKEEGEYRTQIFLIIKAKIESKRLLSKTARIFYTSRFSCDKEDVTNRFIFDVKPKPLQYWVMKECTIFHQDSLNKAYFQPIMQFDIGDYLELTINIFTEKGLMNIRKLKWLTIKLYPTPITNFFEFSNENSNNKEIVDFDMSRYCELELLKCRWSVIDLMPDPEDMKKTIHSYFDSLFDIREIMFDDVGYYILKVYLEARSIGSLGVEKALGIIIKVLPNNNENNKIVSNEVKKNNLIYDRKNELQVHLGDILAIYISKNKD